MKKVLWITSYFLPEVSVAAIRSVKFLKYLPQLGWQAVVICPAQAVAPTEASQMLLSQLSPSVIISYARPDPFQYMQGRRFLEYLVDNIIPPDGHIYWALLALPMIKREVAKHKPDIVYTSCSPFSLNLIGAWVKRAYQIPWVTDFRDLWTLNPGRKRILYPYNRFISERLEKYYLRRCDVLVTNTENSRNRMAQKYPWLRHKLQVISNGFDPGDIQPRSDNNVIPNSIFYGGSIYEKTGYSPLSMLKLLAELANKGYLNPTSLELHYAGGQSDAFLQLVREAGFQVKCEVHGYLDHTSYYRLIQRMAYVLLCMPNDMNSSSWIPARLYDYIGSNSRIIGLVSRDSEVAHLLEHYGRSLVLFYDENIDTQAQKLCQFLLDSKKPGELSEELIRNFSREVLAAKLAQLFQQVTAAGRMSSAPN